MPPATPFGVYASGKEGQGVCARLLPPYIHCNPLSVTDDVNWASKNEWQLVLLQSHLAAMTESIR